MNDAVQNSPFREAEIALHNISTDYGEKSVLNNVSLDILRGEFLAIIGPSASGKSTLLRCVNLLQPLSGGEILYRGVLIAKNSKVFCDVDKFRQKVGLVYQEWNLFPNKTVLQNVTEAPRFVLKTPSKEAVEKASEWLSQVGVYHVKDRYPFELSGGQKQRVALARALAMNPDVLMMDEITSALDVETVDKLLRLLESLKDGHRTFVFVSHHLEFVRRAADRTVVLVDGEIAEVGISSEIISRPQNSRVREFLSAVKATK